MHGLQLAVLSGRNARLDAHVSNGFATAIRAMPTTRKHMFYGKRIIQKYLRTYIVASLASRHLDGTLSEFTS